MDNAAYKPHWVRKSTAQRERETKKAKRKFAFDTACTVMLMVYTVGLFLWILNDAFPHLFW